MDTVKIINAECCYLCGELWNPGNYGRGGHVFHLRRGWMCAACVAKEPYGGCTDCGQAGCPGAHFLDLEDHHLELVVCWGCRQAYPPSQAYYRPMCPNIYVTRGQCRECNVFGRRPLPRQRESVYQMMVIRDQYERRGLRFLVDKRPSLRSLKFAANVRFSDGVMALVVYDACLSSGLERNARVLEWHDTERQACTREQFGERYAPCTPEGSQSLREKTR